jgi:hypothetical protein
MEGLLGKDETLISPFSYISAQIADRLDRCGIHLILLFGYLGGSRRLPDLAFFFHVVLISGLDLAPCLAVPFLVDLLFVYLQSLFKVLPVL